MISLFRSRRWLLLAMVALILPLAVACSGGDDEDDADTEPTASAPGSATTPDIETTPSADEMTTPDADATEEGDSTPDAGMTGTPDSAMDETPDTGMTGTPDADSAETPDADMSGTPDADVAGTPDAGAGVGGAMTDIDKLQADVPNFTLHFNGDFENVPDPEGGTMTSGKIDTTLEQSEPGVYHLAFQNEGEQAVNAEIWSLGDRSFISQNGSTPVEVPGGIDDQVSPSSMLMVLPPIESLDMAEEVGQEDVSGRSATHYRLNAEQAAQMLAGEGATVSDADGELDIWIDEDLGFLLQVTGENVTWTNEDGTSAAVTIDYMVSDIGETPDVEAPSS